MITYNYIKQILTGIRMPYVTLINQSRTEDEIIAIEFYVPSLSKDAWLDYTQALFRGNDVTITYLPNSSMIRLIIPNRKDVVTENRSFTSGTRKFIKESIN